MYLLVLLLLYAPDALPEKIDAEEGFIQTYFCSEINCSYFLESFLEQRITYCALYDLDEPSLLQTITQQHTSVKLFEDYYEEWMPENIVSVGSKALMHHKFCVDEQYVLTGSWNPTERGTYKNDNYILFVKSKLLSENYKKAYDSLEEKQQAIPLKINLSGILVENYFCPTHHCEEEVLEKLEHANESVYILAFSFTSKPIAEKLVEKKEKGLHIEVLFEKTRIASYSQYQYLNASNVTVYKDTNPYTMHEKAFIIDNKTVILGSYNPTKAATEKNDENILIIHDEEIANEFLKEFKRLLN